MARGLGRVQGTESARGPVQAVKRWQWPRALIKAYKQARNERLAAERQRMADTKAFVQAENQKAQDQREQEWLLKQQLMVLRGEYQDERLNGGRTSSMVELNRWDKWVAENNNKLEPLLGEDTVNDVVVGAWQEGYKIGREEGALLEQDNRRAWREEAYGWEQLPEAIIAGATVRDLAIQHNCGEQHIQEELHKQRKRRTPRKRFWSTRLLLAVVVIGGCNHLDELESEHKDALIITERTALQQGYHAGHQEGYDQEQHNAQNN